MHEYSFPNIYRLKSKKVMDELFVTAHSKLCYPVLSKFKYVEVIELQTPFQIGFSVPKRRIRKAVHRNLIKRRMLEAFRLNKSLIADNLQSSRSLLAIIFIYTSNEILDFNRIEKSVIKQLKHISKTIQD